MFVVLCKKPYKRYSKAKLLEDHLDCNFIGICK